MTEQSLSHTGHDQDHDAHHLQVRQHHRPGPDDPHAYEAANKQYFDSKAHQHGDRPSSQALAEKTGRAILNTSLFKHGETTVMDFACGTGLVSRVLAAEDPKSIVGVDISQAMVDQYNKIVSDHGIPPEEMRAICATIPDEKLEGMKFDVIVCASAYHHLPSIDHVTQTLVSTYLNPGGSLLVTDIVHGESTHEIFEDHHHIVAHKGGFTEPEIRSTFEKAGLKNITFDIIARGKHTGREAELFLARGDK